MKCPICETVFVDTIKICPKCKAYLVENDEQAKSIISNTEQLAQAKTENQQTQSSFTSNYVYPQTNTQNLVGQKGVIAGVGNQQSINNYSSNFTLNSLSDWFTYKKVAIIITIIAALFLFIFPAVKYVSVDIGGYLYEYKLDSVELTYFSDYPKVNTTASAFILAIIIIAELIINIKIPTYKFVSCFCGIAVIIFASFKFADISEWFYNNFVCHVEKSTGYYLIVVAGLLQIASAVFVMLDKKTQKN